MKSPATRHKKTHLTVRGLNRPNDSRPYGTPYLVLFVCLLIGAVFFFFLFENLKHYLNGPITVGSWTLPPGRVVNNVGILNVETENKCHVILTVASIFPS